MSPRYFDISVVVLSNVSQLSSESSNPAAKRYRKTTNWLIYLHCLFKQMAKSANI